MSSPLGLLAIAVATLVLIELAARAISVVGERVLGRAVPRVDRFLEEQSRQLAARLKDRSQFRSRFHERWGWEPNRGRIAEGEHINQQGVRGEIEYPPEPTPGTLRIAAFGDSFVYGADAVDEVCWSGRLERSHRVEVLNYGVGGYGLDQCLLRYRDEGARARADVVLLGITTVMASRVVSRYRRFENPGDGALFKPRFVLEGGALRLLPAPVPSDEAATRLLEDPLGVIAFGERDYWYMPAMFEHRAYRYSSAYRLGAYAWFRFVRRYLDPDRIRRGGTLNPDSESFRLLRRIAVEFADAVRSDGARCVVMFFPMEADVEARIESGSTPYEPLRASLAEAGLTVVDPIDHLMAGGPPDALYGPPLRHYSALGNERIAGAVAAALALDSR